MMKPWDCKRCKNEATCILAGDMQATASCNTFAPVPEKSPVATAVAPLEKAAVTLRKRLRA